jgi:hypothetical protein
MYLSVSNTLEIFAVVSCNYLLGTTSHTIIIILRFQCRPDVFDYELIVINSNSSREDEWSAIAELPSGYRGAYARAGEFVERGILVDRR